MHRFLWVDLVPYTRPDCNRAQPVQIFEMETLIHEINTYWADSSKRSGQTVNLCLEMRFRKLCRITSRNICPVMTTHAQFFGTKKATEAKKMQFMENISSNSRYGPKPMIRPLLAKLP